MSNKAREPGGVGRIAKRAAAPFMPRAAPLDGHRVARINDIPEAVHLAVAGRTQGSVADYQFGRRHAGRLMRPWLAEAIIFGVVARGLFPASHAADTYSTEGRDAESALARALRGERDVEPPRLGEAEELVSHAEAACRQGDVILASRKAQEALGILNGPSGSRQGRGAKMPPPDKTPRATRPSDADYYQ